MKDIIPAILPKHFSDLSRKVGLVAGTASFVQVDVCDRTYTDSKTWPFNGERGTIEIYDVHFRNIMEEKEGLPFWDTVDYEFDLMVKKPEGVIGDFVRAGASRILVHLESTSQMEDIIREWKDVVELGIALKPATPLADLDSYMHEVKIVQMMGSDYIGHGGVSLEPSIYERVRTFKEKYPEHIVSVDIGVNFETAPDLVMAGVDHLVAGSAIFGNPNPLESIARFKELFV
ncbi:MAG: hypothetical protein COV91_05365 [Candidatus Taylorbacteria bacterium CG11_big_fil_rev_8_21_14_0_20_46_11]|uniref:Ribulose-phosphate 3-epimerase n=1 Tax=Candidatus Taylorbacteria bacterium CG11_big_fil_rev_8_21_14_0_20_46_11 TaxID=1975025 RepID=A0A2H0KAD5_9BACT|nr:MAG: hypothetical protein COV91_05365 [Candidatus Taylorbacteria bacterium CG11_big_fil_rev_8_21_14_0_20_46_11]